MRFLRSDQIELLLEGLALNGEDLTFFRDKLCNVPVVTSGQRTGRRKRLGAIELRL